MKNKMNRLGKERRPFLFIIDFNMENPQVIPIDRIDPDEILFDLRGFSNTGEMKKQVPGEISLKSFPVSYEIYRKAFDKVMINLEMGNSYLVNLTMPTMLKLDHSLEEIFFSAVAPYKLLYKNRFIVFSPEAFVRIEKNIISSYPMKGTIDAGLNNAERLILSNEKEHAEHLTIVDLIRNDLNLVAEGVTVERFRYLEKIVTAQKELLQVSSRITGLLPASWHESVGDVIFNMLPAGSISGAPKKKTVEIIKEAEQYDRGYYTGVFGYYDGDSLESAVMIRFIEKNGNDYIYKSGGGITLYSNPAEEYQEMIDKIYVPIG